MSSIAPNSPLITLEVTPSGETTVKDVLARFHPVMKQQGFGSFEMEQEGFYQASKAGGSILSSEKYVFAEVVEDKVIINIDGHSIFGLKGVEQELTAIKNAYDSSLDCNTKLDGPNYASAFVGNLIYTVLPIYLSAFVVALLLYNIGMDGQIFANLFIYSTLGVIGAKTRFWVGERRKKRPVWLSVSILLLGVPLVLLTLALIFWLVQTFG